MPPLRSLVPVPHLTLHRKAFIALAALLLALLLIFVGFSRLGLQRGLGPYVAEIELARMDWLAERLQSHHTQTGGWDSLRGQPALWGRLTHSSGGPRGPGGSRPGGGLAPSWNARFGGIVQRAVSAGDNAKSAPFGQQCSGQSVTGDHQHHALDD